MPAGVTGVTLQHLIISIYIIPSATDATVVVLLLLIGAARARATHGDAPPRQNFSAGGGGVWRHLTIYHITLMQTDTTGKRPGYLSERVEALRWISLGDALRARAAAGSNGEFIGRAALWGELLDFLQAGQFVHHLAEPFAS